MMKMSNKILICAPVHTTSEIFAQYIYFLERASFYSCDTCDMDFAFYFHNCDFHENVTNIIHKDLLKCFYRNDKTEYDISGETHKWEKENFNAVAEMKNELIHYCLDGDYTHFFLVDSDVLIHKKTLGHLLDLDLPVVASGYFTRWDENSAEIGPNCFDKIPNGFRQDIGGIDRFKIPGIYKVLGAGACILIKREVLEKGANYSHELDENIIKHIGHNGVQQYNNIFNANPQERLWEDRPFSIKAMLLGYDTYFSTIYLARHLYRQSDYDRFIYGKPHVDERNL